MWHGPIRWRRLAGVATALALAACVPAGKRRAAKAPPPDPVWMAHRAEAQAFLNKASVHAPVRALRCTACHDPVRPVKETVKPLPDLCFGCHANRKADAAKPHTHPPFSSGECGTCHDPHAGDAARLLATPVKELCVMCHDAASAELRKPHGGIVVSSVPCTDCHTPHGSDTEHLIWETGLHPPFEARSCEMCHKKPGPGGKRRLQETTGTFCLTCHGDTAPPGTAAVRHPPFERGQCWTCHNPHRSPERVFLRRPIGELCRECHPALPWTDHPVTRHPQGKAGLVDPKQPGKPFDCTSCHRPHGSAHAGLRAYAPGEFCTACHAK